MAKVLVNSETLGRFYTLFKGNERSFGQCQKSGTKYRQWTEKRCVTPIEFGEHLNGSVGVGIVPIKDDGTVWFGTIDIDAHGDVEDIDLRDLVKTIDELNLPLIVCRSKSGGAHCYAFTSEPVEASQMRTLLANWASKIGFPGVEIFPKQSHLKKQEDGVRPLGNWINLCYAGGASTDRYAVKKDGGKMTLDYFLDCCENARMSRGDVHSFMNGDHGEAPPCIQKMIEQGVPSGSRNEALYNITIYLKKSNPENYRDKAFDMNSTIFDNPLPHTEAKRTITSASRREYKYRCGEDPCRRYCNRELCITKRFGITVEESTELVMPEFGPLRKFLTEPVKWGLKVDNKEIIVSTNTLMDYRKLTEAIVEELTKIVPIMKTTEWQRLLNTLMVEVELVSAPDDASTPGVVRARLSEFIKKADTSAEDMKSKKARDPLTRGIPVMLEYEDKKCVFFRGSDFVDYLKRTRSEELKGSALWMALKRMGVQYTRLRVGHTVITSWYIEVTEQENEKIVPEFITEF